MSSAEPVDCEEEVRTGLRSAVAAFRYRNFALFWTGALISNTGGWVQNVTVPYVVFKLTDSKTWVGFAGFSLLITAALFGPVGGSLADRFDRRKVLLIMQSAQAAVAMGMWAYWLAGGRSPGVIVAAAALSGVFAGLLIGSWQAFVSELVPKEALLNAVTLNSAQFNAARAFGPAIGGIVLALVGPAWAFFINGVSFVAVIGALLAMRLDRVVAKAVGRIHVVRDLKETFGYVKRSPGIRTCVIVVAGLGFADSPLFQFVVVFAEDVFKVDAWVFGVLSAGLGIGAIIGTPFVAGWGSTVSRQQLVAAAMVLNGTSLILFALSPNAYFGFFALMGAGAGYLAIASSLNTTIQLQVDEQRRGKVLAFYVLGITLTAPIGSLLQGVLVDVIGARAAFSLAGAAFLSLLLVLRAKNSLRHLDEEKIVEPAPASTASS